MSKYLTHAKSPTIAIQFYKQSFSIWAEIVGYDSESTARVFEKMGSIEEAHFFRIRGHEYKELEDPDDFSILFENLGL